MNVRILSVYFVKNYIYTFSNYCAPWAIGNWPRVKMFFYKSNETSVILITTNITCAAP